MALIEFENLPDTSTPLKAENLNSNFNELNGIDYASQCTFQNCTFNAGKIMKIGRIVYIQMKITATANVGWDNFVTLPETLRPLVIHDYGSGISGTEFWVYDTGPAAVIRGELIEGTTYNIVGSYLARI